MNQPYRIYSELLTTEIELMAMAAASQRIPVYRVPGMLDKIEALFVNQTV